MAEPGPIFSIYQFVIIALLIVGIVRVLKWRGLFSDSDLPVFDKIVTEIAVPAIIFSVFATAKFTPDTLLPSAILFLVLIIALGISYAVCRLCRCSYGVTGTVVMIAGFGSTATMANPLLQYLFISQPGIIDRGFIIGTLGVAFPFFTLGVLIASYFGAKEAGKDVRISDTLRDFLGTPIFISFIAGGAVALFLMYFQVPGGQAFFDIFTHFFTILSLSLGLLIWIAIGLMLRPIPLRVFLPVFGMVIAIKLLFEPFAATLLAVTAAQPLVMQQVLLLLSAVPSGAVASVLASRYGCDSSLAGWMVVGTYLACLLTIPLVFLLVPG